MLFAYTFSEVFNDFNQPFLLHTVLEELLSKLNYDSSY